MLELFKTTETGEFLVLDAIEKDCWISLTNPTREELAVVVQNTGIDVDVLCAALDEEERARIEVEDNYTMILIDAPDIEKEVVDEIEKNRYATIPLAMITARHYIITICLKDSPVLQYFKDKRLKGFYTYKKTRFIMQIFYRVATLYLHNLRVINHESERIETKLYGSPENQELIELLELEKALVYFTTALRSNEVVFEKMLRNENIQKYPEDEELLEDVIIENKQALEMANIYSGILTATMETFSSIISNNQNSAMKFLATITIVMSIPTILASFYGMNVPLPGQSHPYGFLFVMTAALVLVMAIVIIFRKKALL